MTALSGIFETDLTQTPTPVAEQPFVAAIPIANVGTIEHEDNSVSVVRNRTVLVQKSNSFSFLAGQPIHNIYRAISIWREDTAYFGSLLRRPTFLTKRSRRTQFVESSKSQPSLICDSGQGKTNAINEEKQASRNGFPSKSNGAMGDSNDFLEYEAILAINSDRSGPKIDRSDVLQDGEKLASPNLDMTPTMNGEASGCPENLFAEEDIAYGKNGEMISGSLPALIKRLIPTNDYCPEKSFVFVFLLNARMHISPVDLLDEVCKRCLNANNNQLSNNSPSKNAVCKNILKFCKEWTETFPYDFRSEPMLKRLKEMMDFVSKEKPLFKTHTRILLQNLINKLTKLEKYETALLSIKNGIKQRASASDILAGVNSICDCPVTVAQQLTHVELERLNMIGPEELLYAVLKENTVTKNGVKGGCRSKNVQNYVDWFNRLNCLVASDICKHLKKKHRVQAIDFHINVAKECFNIGNFNSLMAIIGALNATPVTRLKKTWQKVDRCKLDILQHLLDPSNNFVAYRASLKAAKWRAEGATKAPEKIVVPFFSVFVKDLLIIYQTSFRLLPNGHLNFYMFSRFSDHLRDFLEWKRVHCMFEKNSELLQYILASPAFTTEEELQLASYKCESPDQGFEKGHRKQLKLKEGCTEVKNRQ